MYTYTIQGGFSGFLALTLWGNRGNTPLWYLYTFLKLIYTKYKIRTSHDDGAGERLKHGSGGSVHLHQLGVLLDCPATAVHLLQLLLLRLLVLLLMLLLLLVVVVVVMLLLLLLLLLVVVVKMMVVV